MANSVTFNFINPTNEKQNATVFQSKASLDAEGFSTEVGQQLFANEVPLYNDGVNNIRTNVLYAVYISQINAMFFLGENAGGTNNVSCGYYFIDTGEFSNQLLAEDGGGNTFIRTTPAAYQGVNFDGEPFTNVCFMTSSSVGNPFRAFNVTTSGGQPQLEVLSDNVTPTSFAINSPIYYAPQTDALYYTGNNGLNNGIGKVDNIVSGFNQGLRGDTFTGFVGADPCDQFIYDGFNSRLIYTTGSSDTCILFEIATNSQSANFGTITLANGDTVISCIYVPDIDQYCVQIDNAGSTLVFIDNYTVGNAPTDYASQKFSSQFNRTGLITYAFDQQRILLMCDNNPNQSGWQLFDPINKVFTYSSPLDQATGVGSIFYSENFITYNQDESLAFIIIVNNNITGSLYQQFAILDLKNFTYTLVQSINLTPAQNRFRSSSLDANEILYLGSRQIFFPNRPQFNTFSGQETLGSSPIAINTEAGQQTYLDVVQQIQNQDVVITDVYIKTNDVKQANKPITANFISQDGSSYNEEYFPEISPFDAQIVIQDLPFEFTSNSLNTLTYEIDPNTNVEFIFTYEEFERSKSDSQYPDVDRLNRLLGVGKYAIPKNGINLKPNEVQEIQLYNPLMNVIVQTTQIKKNKIDLDEPHQIEISNPLAKVIVKRKFKV